MTQNAALDPKRLGDRAELIVPAWRQAVFPLVCVGCVLGGFSLVQADPPQPTVGWTLSGLAGLCGVAFLARVQIGQRLKVILDREGFTIARLWTTRRYQWRDVSEFAIAGQSAGRSARLAYVVFNADQTSGFERWLTRFLTGRNQMLPVGLVLEDGSDDATTVVAVMNAWRDRALRIRRNS